MLSKLYGKVKMAYSYTTWTCSVCGFRHAIKLSQMMFHVDDKCCRCEHKVLTDRS